NEAETAEEQVLDRATAARTIAELRAEIATLERLVRLAQAVRQSGEDRKWVELAELLRGMALAPGGSAMAPEKLVVFTKHRDTLRYLQDKAATLLGRSEAIVVMHGGMGREERL